MLDQSDDTFLEFEVNSKLVELGNNLVLFFAGLSCEPENFVEYFWAVNILGGGYFVLATVLFALFGWGTGVCIGSGSIIFFGIACSLSSRQLMKEYLDRRTQNRSMHGKLLQGLALYQDLIAMLALTILYAFQRVMVNLDDVNLSSANANATTLAFGRRANTTNETAAVVDATTWVPANVWHDRYRLGDEIGRSICLMALVGLIFAALNRTVLERLFRFFTIDGEMLFIGTMAYNFGGSAICYQIGLSPMVGSYFAGLSLAFLPSRVQIQNKVASLRGYGMTTFYFMMGIYVHLNGDFFKTNFTYSICVTLMNVLVRYGVENTLYGRGTIFCGQQPSPSCESNSLTAILCDFSAI